MADEISSRSPFKLRKDREPVSNDTLFVTTIGTGLAVISAVAIAGWTMRGFAEDYKAELKELKRTQQAYDAMSWTVIDMSSFSADLRYQNPNLKVVDPYQIRRR